MTALLTNLLTIYGYWLIFALVGIESIGLRCRARACSWLPPSMPGPPTVSPSPW
jgi:hypothetical protein